MLLSSSHETFTKLGHILGDKIHHNKLKRIEIIQCLLLDHNGINLETNNVKINRQPQNKVKIKHHTSE